jgi:hypothetical protein
MALQLAVLFGGGGGCSAAHSFHRKINALTLAFLILSLSYHDAVEASWW